MLVVAAITLAAPAKAAQHQPSLSLDEVAILETEIGPVQTVVLR